MAEIIKRRLTLLQMQIDNSEGLIKKLLIRQYNELVLDWKLLQSSKI